MAAARVSGVWPAPSPGVAGPVSAMVWVGVAELSVTVSVAEQLATVDGLNVT